jgi:glycolate oxidase
MNLENLVTAMEKIIGKRFVCADPGILDTYAYNWNADNLTGGVSKFAHRPLCVVMPDHTSEIVEIVKYCNQHKLQFKAMSTGWGVHNTVGKAKGVIQLDLKRMNRILSIDPKNCIAIVEPYVSGAMLQAEIFKFHLNCHIQGCGANGSQLASVTSMVGQGWTGISTGFSNRNILGTEWVLPDGQICKIGSWGNIAQPKAQKDAPYEEIEVNASEWFLADGPGPSLRGAYRGYFGAFGGLGVFTKAAIKLYHWSGPEQLELQGYSPTYNLKKTKLPPNVATYILNWKTWDDFKNAGYALADSEVCWALCRVAGFISGLGILPSNDEFYKKYEELFGDLQYNLIVVTMATTKREFKYHKQVIQAIVDATNGEIFPMSQDPFFSAFTFMAIAKQCNTMRGVFRAGGGFFTSLGALGSWDWCVEGAKIGEKLKQKAIASGGIVDDGADNVWGLPYEHGTFSHLEELYMYDITDPESRKASVEYLKSVVEASQQHPLGLGLGTVDGEGSAMHAIFGPLACNYHKWLKAIKQEFDPNNASDPGFYIDPEKIKD